MNFEENVDKLSKKYDLPRGQVYDLMAIVHTSVGIVRPMEALRNKEVFSRKVYLIANSQLRERYQTKSEPKPIINSQERAWPEISKEDYLI